MTDTTAGEMTRADKIRAARRIKLDGVFGEGRAWAIKILSTGKSKFEMEEGTHFETFLGHKGRTGYVLEKTKGPKVTTDLPEGQSQEQLLVGPGLLKVALDEYPGTVQNPEATKVSSPEDSE